ncbi:hypothetical protein [Deinococcus sonorensis]|uniref:Uncharacterized protein n=2 Tax=Deinococcus sonorensis TaxID=309891 RepID=A0AAU7U6G7_9DEIO
MYASKFEVTAQLLEAGVDPTEWFDGTECSAMATAVEQAWPPGSELFISPGEDVNAREDGGWTPLLHVDTIETDGVAQAGEAPSLEL